MKHIGVRLPHGMDAAYDVLLKPGLLGELPALLRARVPAAAYAVVSDSNVAPLHGEALTASLQAAGLEARLFAHPAGERHKTRSTWSALTDALLDWGLGRDGCVLALGGGVAGDLAGFVAATYLRGVPVVQLPTSLLAMVDAAVGGKTGVDAPQGKNLIGAFHPPRLVVIDPQVLRTLPLRELRNGLAEVVKHGAIADAAYLERVHTSAGRLLAGDAELLSEVIARSVELKSAVVERDPWEQGERAVLNFGHTLGHALERVTGYATPHGEAVGIGMVLAARIGERLGVTAAGTAAALGDALVACGLPVAPPHDVAWRRLLEAARSDKKNRAGGLRLVLLRRLGEVARAGEEWTHGVAEEALSHILATV